MAEVNNLRMYCASSLEKIFPDEKPREMTDEITALQDETVSFQVAYHFDAPRYIRGKIEINTVLPCHIRKVSLVPVNYPCHRKKDDGYLRTTPGLYPDLLEEIIENKILLVPDQWQSIWVDLIISRETVAGEYPVEIQILDDKNEILAHSEVKITVVNAVLPKLPIKHTEWFYADCLADYYKVEVFSQKHWELIANFMKSAADRKCNMILTPIFTPPLDTAVGGERTTVQLIGITVTNGNYYFDFSKLAHWIKLAGQCGFYYFELSHLFTQWGVKAAPKVMATVDGVYQRIFGWDTPALGGGYEEFLKSFLPELTEELKKLGIADRTYFHISDEPDDTMIEDYRKAKALVAPYLKGFPIIDALSDYHYYELGLVEHPVCAIDRIDTFLHNNVENLWSYYCTAQCMDVPNRFMALPSYRNRIYGILVYLFQITGILHWGYNFYNNEVSRGAINPYRVTDCEYAVPSGDPFLVYPGPNGMPEESIRMMVQYEAMTDLCAMYLLEEMTDRQTVVAIIEEQADRKITFSNYPTDMSFCIRVRNRINVELMKRSH